MKLIQLNKKFLSLHLHTKKMICDISKISFILFNAPLYIFIHIRFYMSIFKKNNQKPINF